MLIAFHLSMPSNNAWDGKWSGEGNQYVVVRSIRKVADAAMILARGPYRYAFGDGWVASIRVEEVDRCRAAKLRRSSRGFCGYEWMVTSILGKGKIIGPQNCEHNLVPSAEVGWMMCTECSLMRKDPEAAHG